MSGWAGCSRETTGGRRRLCLLVLLCGIPLSTVVEARVLLRQEEALTQAFPPPAKIERRTLFLDDEQAARVGEVSGVELKGGVISYYVGQGEQGILGYAYFDRHLVRTLPETIMVLVRPQGTIERITILSFDEPEDYLPKETWLQQFRGRSLDEDLAIRRGIRNLTGASLSSTAIASACRKILALHRIVTQETVP